jgi:hypothetical protein
MQMFARSELVEMKIRAGTMADPGPWIMESYLILPPFGCGYQVVTFQHLTLDDLKGLLPPPFLSILQSLSTNLLGGQKICLPRLDFSSYLTNRTLFFVEFQEDGHDMLAAASGIWTVAVSGDRPIHDNFRAIIAVIAIDLVHLPAIAALFRHTAKGAVSLQKFTALKNERRVGKLSNVLNFQRSHGKSLGGVCLDITLRAAKATW